MNKVKNKRIDNLLVERGFVESRSKAQRLVMAGQVRADGQIVQNPRFHSQMRWKYRLIPVRDMYPAAGKN